MKRIVSMTLSLALLTACSTLAVRENKTFTLTPTLSASAKTAPTHKVLWVSNIRALPHLQTPRMHYQQKPYQLESFAYHLWASTPAQALEPWVIRALEQTHHFQAIVESPAVGKPDYGLKITLEDFQQEMLPGTPPVFKLTLRAQLMTLKSHQILLSKRFEARAPMTHNTPESGVEAAQIACEKVLQAMVDSVLAHTS